MSLVTLLHRKKGEQLVPWQLVANHSYILSSINSRIYTYSLPASPRLI